MNKIKGLSKKNKIVLFFIIIFLILSIFLRVQAKYNYSCTIKAFTILKSVSNAHYKRNVEKNIKNQNGITQEETLENSKKINNNDNQVEIRDDNSLKYVINKRKKNSQ